MPAMPPSSLSYTDAEWSKVLEKIKPRIENADAKPIDQRKF